MLSKMMYLWIFVTMGLNLVPDVSSITAYESLPQNCGASLGPKIFGGSSAGLGYYPWLVRLGYKIPGNNNVTYDCAGSLINDRYVVTAAQCVTRHLDNRTLVTIRAGEFDDRTDPDCEPNDCAEKVQDFTPEEVISHEKYHQDNLRENDIALIRLNKPARFSPYVSAICVPFGPFQPKDYTNRTATIAGWGLTPTEGGVMPSNRLLAVDLPVLPFDRCYRLYQESVSKYSHICAGTGKGKFSCKGDGGGPLMIIDFIRKDNDHTRYVAAGVMTAATRGVNLCGDDGYPSVYTQVSSYMDWILSHIEP